MGKIKQEFTDEGIIAHFRIKQVNHQHNTYRETCEFFTAVSDLFDRLTVEAKANK